MTGYGLGDPQQADQRAGHQHDDRYPARLAGGDLGPERGGDLRGVTKFTDRRRGGQPSFASACVGTEDQDEPGCG